MNFFTQGIGNVAGTYADYLDALIGNIDDRLLTYVVSATPEIQKGKLTPHHCFLQDPILSNLSPFIPMTLPWLFQ